MREFCILFARHDRCTLALEDEFFILPLQQH
jgi:hypothetical protein